ncbi:TIP41-domain-containing protein [Apiospora marii]|uniref:TIP41-domain-containing protein n=1 Tax=Apiospora marii TaxID=335849 RepID=A0ABR1SNT7_9PEZI
MSENPASTTVPASGMGPPGHVTSAQEPYPSAAHLDAATSSHTQGNFTITTRKLPISKAGPISAMELRLGIPVPEMIFGDNVVAVAHRPTGWRIEFNAYDALDAVDKTDKNMLQVAYAQSWSASREQTSAGIKEVVKPYDWSYSTMYKGSTQDDPAPAPHSSSPEANAAAQLVPKLAMVGPHPDDETRPAASIPIELLKRRDPILFFDDVVLYESELDDNGISMLSVKTRVHEKRMLLLCRLFMRLDHVIARVRDTRIYVDFETDEVIREYTMKEDSYEELKKAFLMSGETPDGVTVALRDGNKVAEVLPIIDQTIESVNLKQP